MATLIIPCRTDLPRYFFTLDLEGVTYTLHFEWNDRASKWFMNLNDLNDQPVLSSIGLVLGVAPLADMHHLAVPSGEFVLIDTSGQGLDAGYSDLGERVVLAYVESTGG